MEYTKHSTLSLLKALAIAVVTIGVVALAHAQDKVDPSGTWTWGNAGRNGRPGYTNTLVLSYANDALTGSLSTPKRGGGTNKIDISEGKLTGAKVTFNITREFNGNSMTIEYEGTVTADSITGTTTLERDGEKHSRKWMAKRATGDAK